MLHLESWQLEAMGQIVLAAVIGGIVGLEREYHGRAAGFRTHLLVCIGCCLVMILSLHFARHYHALNPDPQSTLRIDPARLAYSIMGGIGFLGAGAIIKYGVYVRGLTTAASLWCTAAIGMACGFGLYFLALFTAGVVLFTLLVLNSIERIIAKHWYKTIRVVCSDNADDIERISTILASHNVTILDMAFDRNLEDHTVTITYEVRYNDRGQSPAIYRTLTQHTGLRSVHLE